MRRYILWLLIGMTFPSVAWAFDPWPQWRGRNRDGVSAEKGLLPEWNGPPPLLWRAEGLGEGYSSVVVQGGLVCTMGDRNGKTTVAALREKDGAEVWSTRVAERDAGDSGSRFLGPRSTPTMDDDRLYAVSANGVLACLKTASGERVWSKSCREDFHGEKPGWGYSESPLIDGDKLIYSPGGPDAHVVALDKKTGAELWRCKLSLHEERRKRGLPIRISYSSPVVSKGGGVKQYIKYYGGGLGGIHAETGKQLWNYGRVDNVSSGDDTITTPIVHGDYVFASAAYGGGSAVVKLEPVGDGGVQAKEVWCLPANQLQIHHGSAVLVGGCLYLGHGENQSFPKCVEFLTGKMMWDPVRAPGVGSAAVAYADNRLYYLYENGVVTLVAATPKQYQLKGKFRIPDLGQQAWACPVISAGRLYLRVGDALYCYDLRK